MKQLINQKISARQLVFVFLLTILSSAIRVFPLSHNGLKQGGWLALVLGACFFGALVLFCGFVACKNAQCACVPRRLRAIYFVYALWFVLLAAMHARHFAERILSLIVPDCALLCLLLPMIVLTAFAAKSKSVYFARFCEICFKILVVVFAFILVLLARDVDFTNFSLPQKSEVVPSLHASLEVFAIFGQFVFVFMLSNAHLPPKKVRGACLACFLGAIIIGACVYVGCNGVLGYRLNAQVTYPFFEAVKNITALQPLNHLEPLVLSVWVFSDFAACAFFALLAVKILLQVFAPQPARPVPKHAAPLYSCAICLVILLAAALPSSAFFLQGFWQQVITPVTIVLECAFPLFMVFTSRRKASQ